MKIAVTSLEGVGLKSPVAAHFGHAPYFTILDINNDFEIIDVNVITNQSTGEAHRPGMVPAMLIKQGVNMLITGALGQRAFQLFQNNNISVVPGAMNIDVEGAYNAYIRGELKAHENYGMDTHHNVNHLHPEHHHE